jgi:hypothetical protein
VLVANADGIRAEAAGRTGQERCWRRRKQVDWSVDCDRPRRRVESDGPQT